METVITSEMDPDTGLINVVIDSGCPMVNKMAGSLKTVDYISDTKVPIGETSVYLAAGESIGHISCPVPCAVLKALEVSSGMGLKRDFSVKIE